MNQYGIFDTTICVVCPSSDQIHKVYVRSIPNKNIHVCNGCDFMNGSSACKNCICAVTSLFRDGKIKVFTNTSDDILNNNFKNQIGTSSNPLWLK